MVNMKTKINMAGPLIRVLTIISIVVLSASLVSATGTAPPNKFTGTVTLNDLPAPIGTVITVYVGGVEQNSVVIKTEGSYVQLGVIGSEGDAITFEVGGVSEDHTGVIWHEYASPRTLDLTTTGTPVAYVDSSSSGGSSGTYPTDVDTGEETSDGANTSIVSEDVVTSDAPTPTATSTATDESGAESGEETGNGFPWIVLIIVGLAVVAIILYLSRK